MQEPEDNSETLKQLCVSFGYQCCIDNLYDEIDKQIQTSNTRNRSSSFSCLSGAALNANATLANTSICNGIIGAEILPGLDSPKSFQRMASSPSLSRLDLVASTSQSSMSTLDESLAVENDSSEVAVNLWKTMRGPARTESSSFLNGAQVQMAGGAAGEDRVQAVCSEGSDWLFCGVYDGFNGRDAADFLAGTLYDTIGFNLHMLERQVQEHGDSSITRAAEEDDGSRNDSSLRFERGPLVSKEEGSVFLDSSDPDGSFHQQVLGCLCHSLAQAENDFMNMVEQEMEDRPDLVSVGSSVLVLLLRGMDLYFLNLGDSRAVLATIDDRDGSLQAVQLTETHTVDEVIEYRKVLAEHPDDPSPITWGRVKGKLKLTRAFGVGYLKKSKMNDALMGILRVQNLCSPPYVDSHPFTKCHRVSERDEFVVLGSDGLFDFFSNDEVVRLVHTFIQEEGEGDPATHLVEQLVSRAAKSAGLSREELMGIPAGRRRKYHDDVTVVVIMLGTNKQRTSTASTSTSS